MLTPDELDARGMPPEPTKVTVYCPECNDAVVIVDVHAFLLGLHQRVCGELAAVNGEPD